MDKNNMKFQFLFCLISGVGMFLPLVVYSSGNESASLNFIGLYDHKTSFYVVDSRIVLGVLILAFIMLFIRLKNNDFMLKLISLLVIVATGVMFYLNIDKLSIAKAILTPLVKYGIGYYMTFFGLIIAAVVGLIDIFSGRSNLRKGYPDDYDLVVNRQYDQGNNDNSSNLTQNSNINTNIGSQTAPNMNNQPVNTNNPPPVNNISIRLSDLVNRNVVNNDNNETNSMDNNQN